MHKLHVFVILVGAFIVANTACRKENAIQQDAAVKAFLDSTGNDTLKPPCDTFPHDTFPHDTFPHDTFPWPPRDTFPHDTLPWPPRDSFPHDTFPWPDTVRRRHK
jgi:hypothetical protein